jgi:hypothetical protein
MDSRDFDLMQLEAEAYLKELLEQAERDWQGIRWVDDGENNDSITGSGAGIQGSGAA